MNIKSISKSKFDLIFILLCCVLLIILIIYNLSNQLRVVIGVAFIIYFPGYALLSCLYPQGGNFTSSERLGLSIGLSLFIAFSLGFILNYLPFGISLSSTIVSVSVFVICTSICALYRRKSTCHENHSIVYTAFNFEKWREYVSENKLYTILLGMSVLSFIGVVIFFIPSHASGERFTEFYLLGTDPQLADYSIRLSEGDVTRITLGVINHEQEDITYTIQNVDSKGVKEIGRFNLGDNEKWEQTLVIAGGNLSDHEKITFLLYKNGEKSPYRSLHLWLSMP